eukprot:scaffold12.g7937.t1
MSQLEFDPQLELFDGFLQAGMPVLQAGANGLVASTAQQAQAPAQQLLLAQQGGTTASHVYGLVQGQQEALQSLYLQQCQSLLEQQRVQAALAPSQQLPQQGAWAPGPFLHQQRVLPGAVLSSGAPVTSPPPAPAAWAALPPQQPAGSSMPLSLGVVAGPPSLAAGYMVPVAAVTESVAPADAEPLPAHSQAAAPPAGGAPPPPECPAPSSRPRRGAKARAKKEAPAGPPKRKGKAPADPSTLTKKQLLAREAQRRFREKQKRTIQETQDALRAAHEEVARLTLSNSEEAVRGAVLERAIEIKDDAVGALQWHTSMAPPPGLKLAPELVEVFQREGATAVYTLDLLSRYAVAGYTGHMEDGVVRRAPPLEKVCEDWAWILHECIAILTEAQREGSPEEQHGPFCDVTEVMALVRDTRPEEVEELQQQQAQQAQQAQQSQLQRQQWLSSARSGEPGAAGTARTSSLSLSLSSSLSPGSSLCQSDPVADAVRAASGSPAGASSAPSLQQPPSPADPAPAGSGAAEERSSEAGAASAVAGGAQGDGDADASHLRVMYSRYLNHIPPSATGIRSKGLSLYEEGTDIIDGSAVYRFSGQLLQRAARWLRRLGVMLWQQALLFPDNYLKLGCLNLLTAQPAGAEAEDSARWRHLLRQLRVRREQLEGLAALHRDYCERVAPALALREQTLVRMRTWQQEQLLETGTGLHEFVKARACVGGHGSINVEECTAVLARTVQVEQAGWVSMSAGVYGLLDFPLQKLRAAVLCAPYFPNGLHICMAAALELGLDPGSYVQPPRGGDAMEGMEAARRGAAAHGAAAAARERACGPSGR